MLDFFIALFGGMYYAGKFEHEKRKNIAYDKQVSDRKNYTEALRRRVCLSYQEESNIKNHILSGENFEQICNDFAEDFRFVFGNNWKDLIRIPPRPPVLNPKLYKNDAYSFYVPANHITWVYRLILSSKGKVDNEMLLSGYSVGGVPDRDISIRFSQCIERHLIKIGVNDVCFVLEQHPVGNTIKFNENLCIYHCSKI